MPSHIWRLAASTKGARFVSWDFLGEAFSHIITQNKMWRYVSSKSPTKPSKNPGPSSIFPKFPHLPSIVHPILQRHPPRFRHRAHHVTVSAVGVDLGTAHHRRLGRRQVLRRPLPTRDDFGRGPRGSADRWDCWDRWDGRDGRGWDGWDGDGRKDGGTSATSWPRVGSWV